MEPERLETDVDSWLAHSAQGRQVADALRRVQPGHQGNVPPANVEAAARRALQYALRTGRTGSDMTTQSAATGARLTWRVQRRWLGAALFGVIAVAGGVVTWQYERAGRSTLPAAPREYATTRGEWAQLMLPNGSRVHLAPETRLQHHAEPDGDRLRVVAGQAAFQVTHDPRRTFMVRAGDITTRVLGTAFDIRYYPGDSAVQVAVTDGKVSAGSEARGMLLTAGMVGTFTDSSAASVATSGAHAVAGWTTGELVFRKTPVSELLATLSRWYGYEFRLEDTVLAKRHVTVTLTAGKRAESLHILGELLSVSVTRTGNVVTLRPRHHTTETFVPSTRRDHTMYSLPREAGK